MFFPPPNPQQNFRLITFPHFHIVFPVSFVNVGFIFLSRNLEQQLAFYFITSMRHLDVQGRDSFDL